MRKDCTRQKLIAILGPTASGKTSLAVQLARHFRGEIISADSRQVFRGLDIGTGKDLKEYSGSDGSGRLWRVPYHLLDVIDPSEEYSLAQYQKAVLLAMAGIHQRGRIPFLAGGSGLYAQAVIDNYQLDDRGPDRELRAALNGLSTEEIFRRLSEADPEQTYGLSASEKANRHRLIRRLEKIKQGNNICRTGQPLFDSLVLALSRPRSELDERIQARLRARLESEDLIKEVENLLASGLSAQRLISFGLEYKYIVLYLQKKLSYEQLFEQLFIAIRQFSRRQLTWLRRWEKQGRAIHWLKDTQEALALTADFLRAEKNAP